MNNGLTGAAKRPTRLHSEASVDQNHRRQAFHIPACHRHDILSSMGTFCIHPDVCAKHSLDVLFGSVSQGGGMSIQILPLEPDRQVKPRSGTCNRQQRFDPGPNLRRQARQKRLLIGPYCHGEYVSRLLHSDLEQMANLPVGLPPGENTERPFPYLFLQLRPGGSSLPPQPLVRIIQDRHHLINTHISHTHEYTFVAARPERRVEGPRLSYSPSRAGTVFLSRPDSRVTGRAPVRLGSAPDRDGSRRGCGAG